MNTWDKQNSKHGINEESTDHTKGAENKQKRRGDNRAALTSPDSCTRYLFKKLFQDLDFMAAI
ncbi:MAG: hypothetical protein JWM56_1045 [Candidatus Peribacteria bacterium]|nr:hypothetical protein [Candidatus Peribacteria bacterium]